MPLDFQNSPANGDQFTAGGVTWRWDGVKWTSVLSSGGPFLPLSGGTVTGKLSLTGGMNIKNLQTTPTGLTSGDVWFNGGVLCVIP